MSFGDSIWLAFMFVAIRLLLINPVAAAEPVGPVAIMRRSWELTAGHFWKLLGCLVLIMIVFIVLALVARAVIGISSTVMAGTPTPGSLTAFIVQLITGILQAIFITYLVVLIARIYAQLAGDSVSARQVFE